MPAIKYSRQRESIKKYLTSTREHPTADTVYTEVKKEFPNISLGTVYRNLNLLTELGEALKISTPDGGDRFDGFTTPHCHFFCRECGSVLDIDMPESRLIDEMAGQNFDGEIESHSIMFFGKCDKCSKK